MIFKVLAATIGVLGFAISLFQAPKKSYAACAFCGGLEYFLYLLFVDLFGSIYVSSILSSILITVVARLLAVTLHMPATIFIISGILPLVPGTGIYYTSYYLITDQWELFKSTGVETLGMAGAIALGIILGSEIPQFIIRKLEPVLRNFFSFNTRLHH